MKVAEAPSAARDDRFSERRDRLTRLAKRAGLDAFLVSNPTNVVYLTGFSGEDAYLVVGPKAAILISDGRFTDQIDGECPGVEPLIRKTGQSMVDAVATIVTKARLPKIGFESPSVSHALWESLREKCPGITWVPRTEQIEQLRAVKDADEIRAIRHAIAIAERAFRILRASVTGADDEKKLADQLDGWIRQSGGSGSSFPPIVASGPRAALPHATPTGARIEESDFLLVDWGARGDFYCSDLTRILVTRKISRKLARIHEIVLRAQRRAIELIRPGVTGEMVDRAARAVIEEAGQGRAFTHSVGHGLGMQVHEAPSLRRGSLSVLEPGMVVTVEPGIYIKGWGGVRLEDDVLVTRDGHEVLTSLPLQLEEMTAA